MSLLFTCLSKIAIEVKSLMSQLVHVCRGNNTMKSCGVVHIQTTQQKTCAYLPLLVLRCFRSKPHEVDSNSHCNQTHCEHNNPKHHLEMLFWKEVHLRGGVFDPSCCETLAKTKGTLKHVQCEPNDPKHHLEQPMETKMCLRGGVLTPFAAFLEKSKLITANKRFCLNSLASTCALTEQTWNEKPTYSYQQNAGWVCFVSRLSKMLFMSSLRYHS